MTQASEAPALVNLRGAAGAVFEFALPLSAVYAAQISSGQLRPADSKSAKLLADAGYSSEQS